MPKYRSAAHLGSVADDIAIVKSMTTDAFNHAPARS